jgi:cyclohexanecarboxylate-CoA ligase
MAEHDEAAIVLDPAHLAPTLWGLLEQRATRTPDRALLLDDTGRTLTAAQWMRRATRVAAALAERGVGPGTRVAWQLPTIMESALLAVALSRLGAVQIPVIPNLRLREVGFIAAETQAEWLITPGTVWRGFDYGAMAAEVAAVTGCGLMAVTRGDIPEADAATLGPPADNDPDDVRYLYYSSGTTAEPKGCRHTEASVMATANGMVDCYRTGPTDCIPVPFAYAHLGGVVWTTTVLRTGCRLLLLEHFDAARSPAAMGAAGATMVGSALPFFRAYLDAQRRAGDIPIFPLLRTFVGGGAPKPPEIHYELKEVFGVGVMSGYGLTECAINACSTPDDTDEQLALTEGRAGPGVELRAVDGDGHQVAAGMEGELRVRAPQLMKGYVNATLDAAAFDAEGFLRTGDLGVIDADGFVRVTGRLKDIIIRNAENISAQEVENVLYRHPSILEAALIGLPDPRTGERACAVVVLHPGAPRPSLAELGEHCGAHGLSHYKWPEQMEVIDALPHNPLGKVIKPELRARFRSSGERPVHQSR